MQKSALNKIATQMHGNGGDFRGSIDLGTEDMRFIWNKDKQTYVRKDDPTDVIPNKASLFATMFGEDFNPAVIAGLYQNIADWDGSKWMKNTELEKDIDKPGTKVSRAWDAFWE